MTTEESFWSKLDEAITELALHEAQGPHEIGDAFAKTPPEVALEFLDSRSKTTLRKIDDVKERVSKLKVYLNSQKPQ